MTRRSELTQFDRLLLRYATDIILPIKGTKREMLRIHHDHYYGVTVEQVYGDVTFRSIRVLERFPTMEEALRFAWKRSKQGHRLTYSAPQVRKLSAWTRQYTLCTQKTTVRLRANYSYGGDVAWQAYSIVGNGAAIRLHVNPNEHDRRRSLRQALRIAME